MAAVGLAVLDYAVLAIMLIISAAIGVYSACSGDRQRTSAEYLLGNRQMNFVTVGLSIMISFTSAVGLLSAPTEIYLFGTTYWWTVLSIAAGALLSAHTILPVFYRLGVTSIYTYLERRYNKLLRSLGLIVFMIQMNLYNAAVIYTPALAINAVTGLSIDFSIVAIGMVCIFYTSIGGIKAVLWADAFQSIFMIAGVVVIVVLAIVGIGGIDEVWRLAEEGGRVVWFDARLDFRLRSTFWTVTIGLLFSRYDIFSNQVTVQRCMTCSTVRKAQQALYVGASCQVLMESLLYFTGVVMFAYFATCDPWSSGQVASPDQIFPYMVFDVFKNVPGMTGLFLASIMSGTMSTISSTCNSMAAVVGEGVIKGIWPNIRESVYTKTNKAISFLFGALTIGLAYLVPVLGDGLVLLVTTIASITTGILAAFVLGACSYRYNWKGAFAGILASSGVLIWMKVGATLHPYTLYSLMPLSTSECPVPGPGNVTELMVTSQNVTTSPMMENSTSIPEEIISGSSGLEDFYHLTHNLYPLFGFTISALVNIFVSWITGFNEPSKVDKELLIKNGAGFCFSQNQSYSLPADNYADTQKENNEGSKFTEYEDDKELEEMNRYNIG